MSYFRRPFFPDTCIRPRRARQTGRESLAVIRSCRQAPRRRWRRQVTEEGTSGPSSPPNVPSRPRPRPRTVSADIAWVSSLDSSSLLSRGRWTSMSRRPPPCYFYASPQCRRVPRRRRGCGCRQRRPRRRPHLPGDHAARADRCRSRRRASIRRARCARFAEHPERHPSSAFFTSRFGLSERSSRRHRSSVEVALALWAPCLRS